jgi:transposase
MGFAGVLQVDGYQGFERLTENGTIVLAACWAHTRRKFYDVFEATQSPIAKQALERIGKLYEIEATVRAQPAEARRQVRQAQSRPLVDAMKLWLEQEHERIPGRAKLAEAIRYALNRWDALTRFIDDGRIELDTNPVERAIRPIALGRKNHLFAGSDGGGARWAIVSTLIETCKLNSVEPYAYLNDVLTRMVEGHPAAKLDELLPYAASRIMPRGYSIPHTGVGTPARHVGIIRVLPGRRAVCRRDDSGPPWQQRAVSVPSPSL